MRRLVVLAALVCVVTVGMPVGVSEAGEDRRPAQAESAPTLTQADIDADSVALAADIGTDGDADWEVVYRLRLDTEAEREAFADLRADVDTNATTYLAPFEERIRRTAGVADNATVREMSVENFTVRAERESQPQSAFGLVMFAFDWQGFAAVDGDTIRAGDALDRLFLDADERLQFRWPEGYSRASSTPAPDTVEQRRVIWRGPIDFESGQPRVVLTGDGGTDTATPVAFGLVAVAVVAVVVALVVWRRQRDETSGERATATGEDTADETGDGAATDSRDEPPPDLLSNEERVLRLLEESGGRMKQQAVAERLDWTAAKTSQVVATLREEEAVESFRLGRENVLTLPDTEIVGSPGADDDAADAGTDDTDGDTSATDGQNDAGGADDGADESARDEE